MDQQPVPPFIYRGQPPPRSITRARIDPSIDTIAAGAFEDCEHLVYVEVHERVRRIENGAFKGCNSLTGFNFQFIAIIEDLAFAFCTSLTSIEFGKELERIGKSAFMSCTSIRRILIPTIIAIERGAFVRCRNLTYAEIGEGLETIQRYTFDGCTSLRCIKLLSVVNIHPFAFRNCEHLTEFDAPAQLKTIGYLAFDGCRRLARVGLPFAKDIFHPSYNAFRRCERLSTVDLVGGVDETISLLGLKQWQQQMNEEIGRINGFVLNEQDKTYAIGLWLRSVQSNMDYYKLEHNSLLKESLALLELALWKTKLDEYEKCIYERPVKIAKIECPSERHKSSKTPADIRVQCRLDCAANIVIENVLPFLHKFEQR